MVMQSELEERMNVYVPTRSTIDAGITAVKASLNSVLSVDHQIAFYCQRPNCDSTPHLAVPKGIRAKKAVCSFAGKPSVLTPEQRVWFGEDVGGPKVEAAIERRPLKGDDGSHQHTGREEGATATRLKGRVHRPPKETDCSRLAEEPKIHQLRILKNPSQGSSVHIIKEVQADWVELTDFLELPSTTVRNLKAERDYTPEGACRSVFELWLNGQGREQKTWRELVKVLRDMEKERLADDIILCLQ